MSQQLTLDLSDEVYAALTQKANAAGLSIKDWIIAVVNKSDSSVSQLAISTEDQEQARQRFKSHAGAVSLGYATGIDNEAIDADLAKAYSDEY